jgi:serine/threonine-protein kinase
MLLGRAAAFLIGGILIGTVVWNLRKPESDAVISFDYDLPADQQVSYILQPFLAVSPDGTQFVYSTTKGLYLRSLDDRDARLISGTENDEPRQPFFSHDGQWIGYWSQADEQLKKIAIGGGAPVLVSNHLPTGSLIWREDDTILFGRADPGILRISANGDSSEVLVESKGEIFYHPRLLPDEKSVLFTTGTKEGYKIAVQSLESGERTELFIGAYAQYLPTGHLVYTHGNDLLAVPFDLKSLKATGGSVLVVGDVFQTSLGAPQYAISESGTLVYASGKIVTASQRTLLWVDLNGNEKPLSAPPDSYSSPKISPDGTKIAWITEKNLNQDVWIWDVARETPTLLTLNERNDGYPVWSPDGQRIAFSSDRQGNFSAIYCKTVDGIGKTEQLGFVPNRWIWPCFWSDDGKELIISAAEVSLNFDIRMLSTEGEGTSKLLLGEEHNEIGPQVSPDGNWMAYASDESGQFDVYVRSFPEVDKFRQKVSTNGGSSPLWSPDGSVLYYRSGGAVMAVDFQTGKKPSLGKPRTLFQGDYASFRLSGESLELSAWDIHPDGHRFLMMKEVEPTDEGSATEGPRQINVILNWFEVLKKSGT